MSNRSAKDTIKYEQIQKYYKEDLLSLDSSCKKSNITLQTYYNICKRIGKVSIASRQIGQIGQIGGNDNEKKGVKNIILSNNGINNNNNNNNVPNNDRFNGIDGIIEYHKSKLSTIGERNGNCKIIGNIRQSRK